MTSTTTAGRRGRRGLRRTVIALVTGAVAATSAIAAAPAASAATPTGTRSLATVLAADGHAFDRNWYDFDIVDAAVAAVLKAKPSSPVSVLADGSVPLTAFLPNDRAFQVLAADVTHRWYRSESQVFTAVAGLGIDTVEQVLLYHVVPGATITSRQALRSDGAELQTALPGATFRVDVLSRWFPIVRLVDNDRNDINPFLVPSKLDLNAGNVQIAHGISFVLRPADL
ncbi:fasciclin domain-containing protein [Angustibacter sp. Root456]|uniref:fasciclin domain-containing protein n=1 Tax=Angustibacter sp. Root456 TaxID=1736539 RepID=UPI0006FC5E55|nr:fasciclin domain-containing protein [Angustibacter sp. Root456]KQX65752.1 fasciclin [Angustibacter sp. Root456]